MSWPWSELGLSGPADPREIRRAYAQRLKTAHPEEDPEGFQRLHTAYQAASKLARQRPAPSPPPSQRPEPEPEQQDWDYRQLLQQDQDAAPARTGPQPAQKDWDYDRLFAEGKEEEEAVRRRKLEEYRRKNRAKYQAQAQQQRKKAQSEARAWADAAGALHALDLLYTNGAPLSQWQDFLDSPVFLSAKGNLDFLFGLEDFLQLHPDLPLTVRRAFYSAYQAPGERIRPEYRPLLRLLKDAAPPPQPGPRRLKLPRLACFILAIMCFIMVLAILTVHSTPSRTGPTAHSANTSQTQTGWHQQVCTWLEEDFGGSFYSFYLQGGRQSIQFYSLFAPSDNPGFLFIAKQEGQRDPDRGQRGYTTNYTQRLLMQELRGFSETWDYPLAFGPEDFIGGSGTAPEIYYFDLPLTGAGEGITALGTLLDALSKEPWYQTLPPTFELFLNCGDLNFYHYRSTQGPFDGDYACNNYEVNLLHAFARRLVAESGLLQAELGEGIWDLQPEGTAEIEGNFCRWLSARQGEQIQRHYFVTLDGLPAGTDAIVYSVPLEMMDQGWLDDSDAQVYSMEVPALDLTIQVWSYH